MRGKYSQTPTPFAHPSHTYVFMEYPTFGGDDGKLQLCVQSLDRKGEVNQGNDRLRVLINRTPKRHRSITALNFFVSPPKTEVPPHVPPMPTPVAKRPLPRFLEVFAPLNAYESEGLLPSNLSSPSTSKSSLPVTPASPHRELRSDPMIHEPSPSYFPIIPSHQKDKVQTSIDNSRANGPQRQCGLAEITPVDESIEADYLESTQCISAYEHTARSDRWPMRGERRTNTLMMDGTFGRV